MNSGLLSFYLKKKDGAEFKELLSDHIETALGSSCRLSNSRIVMFARSIMKNIDFERLLRIAIIFHDSGKAFFQKNLKKLKSGEEYLSFAGHEFVSAILADMFIKELSIETMHEVYLTVPFSVLYHHHAMNPHLREEQNLTYVCKIASENCSGYLNELRSTLEKFLDRDERKILEKCTERLWLERQSILSPAYLRYNLKKKIDEAFIKEYRPEFQKIAFLLLDSLIVCDYIAAQKRGAEASSTFSKAAQMFYNIWFGR
jgi:CRISPR-associated endonuclease Cas3-HD